MSKKTMHQSPFKKLKKTETPIQPKVSAPLKRKVMKRAIENIVPLTYVRNDGKTVSIQKRHPCYGKWHSSQEEECKKCFLRVYCRILVEKRQQEMTKTVTLFDFRQMFHESFNVIVEEIKQIMIDGVLLEDLTRVIKSKYMLKHEMIDQAIREAKLRLLMDGYERKTVQKKGAIKYGLP